MPFQSIRWKVQLLRLRIKLYGLCTDNTTTLYFSTTHAESSRVLFSKGDRIETLIVYFGYIDSGVNTR